MAMTLLEGLRERCDFNHRGVFAFALRRREGQDGRRNSPSKKIPVLTAKSVGIGAHIPAARW